MVSSLTVDSRLRAARGDGGAERDPGDFPGLLLGRLTVLPALVLLPFMLIGFPLLLIGYFKPVPVIAGWLLLAALIVPYAWRRIPSVTGAAGWGTVAWGGRAGPGGRAGQKGVKPTPRWALWSLAAISVAFGVFQATFNSQFVVIQYDAASYMQFATWISAHGTTIIPQNAQFFGHTSSITFAGAAYYQVGNHLVPQFMAGLPMLLSLGFWAGGAGLAVFWGPLLGALAVFTFGGLAARLVGPRWAPFAALAIGVTIPMQYVSRSTWSEPLALILLAGGLSLWIDSQRTDRGEEDAGSWRSGWRQHARSSSHVLAGAAGLLLGLTFLVRLDGPADIMFVVPYCGLLILRRQRQAVPLIAGLIAGTVYGSLDAAFLTAPYLFPGNTVSVELMCAAVIALLIGTVVAVWWLRRRGWELRGQPKSWLVHGVAALPFVVTVVFLLRPLVQRGWRSNYNLGYAPLSLHWIYWYTGFSTIAFAVVGLAMLGRRCVKGEAPVWVLPILVFGCATLAFLYQPAITPHQPYASRRLVPAVLPGLLLLAVWLASWLAQKSRVVRLVDVPGFLNRAPRAFVICCCAAAIVVPPATGNFGGLAFKRTFAGEIAAVDKLCQAIPRGSSVLFIDYSMYGGFGQVIRGTCDVPVAAVHTTIPETVVGDLGNHVPPASSIAAVRAIEDSGHHPFVVATTRAELAPLIKRFGAGTVKLLMHQEEDNDAHLAFGLPRGTSPETWTLYSWEPAKLAASALTGDIGRRSARPANVASWQKLRGSRSRRIRVRTPASHRQSGQAGHHHGLVRRNGHLRRVRGQEQPGSPPADGGRAPARRSHRGVHREQPPAARDRRRRRTGRLVLHLDQYLPRCRRGGIHRVQLAGQGPVQLGRQARGGAGRRRELARA